MGRAGPIEECILQHRWAEPIISLIGTREETWAELLITGI